MKKKIFSSSLLAVAILLIGCAGEEGKAGKDGQACSLSNEEEDSYTLNCPGEDPVTLQDGEDGEAGKDGEDVFQQSLEIYSNYRMGVVRIRVICSDGIGAGTGFKIADDVIITNRHIIECPTGNAPLQLGISRLDPIKDSLLTNALGQYEVISFPNCASNLDITVHLNEDIDLAKLDISNAPSAIRNIIKELPTLPYDTSPVFVVGTPTLVMGYPLVGTDLFSALGTVNSNNVSFFHEDFSISSVLDGGSSGSPIFNVRTGKVIGVYTSGLLLDDNEDGDNDVNLDHGFATGASHFQETFVSFDAEVDGNEDLCR